jgi:hypothetical protein
LVSYPHLRVEHIRFNAVRKEVLSCRLGQHGLSSLIALQTFHAFASMAK